MSVLSENIKDTCKIVVIIFSAILLSPLLIFFFALNLPGERKKITTSIPNIDFDMPYEKSLFT